jgi:hypothetical protein
MEAIRLHQTIQKDGELSLTDLPVIKGQQVEIVLLLNPVSAETKRPFMTARQLLNSGLIGIWQGRTDISDSAIYARQLREQAQRRPDIGSISGDENSG